MKLTGIKNVGGSILGLSLGVSLFLTFIFGFLTSASLRLDLPYINFYLISLNAFIFIMLSVLVSPKIGPLSLKVLAFLCYQLGRVVFATISGPLLEGKSDLSVIFIYFPEYIYLLMAEALLWVFLEIIFLIASKLTEYPYQFWLSILWWTIIGYVSLEILSMKALLVLAIIITLIIKFYQLFMIKEWIGRSMNGYLFSVLMPFIVLLMAFFYGKYLDKERQWKAQEVIGDVQLYYTKYGGYPSVIALQEHNPHATNFKAVYNYVDKKEVFSDAILGASAGYYSSREDKIIYLPYTSGYPYVAYFQPLTLFPCIYVYDFDSELWINQCDDEEEEVNLMAVEEVET